MIDIVIPHYGETRLLLDAVASVCAQTSPDWRLHVLDDRSPGKEVGAALAAMGDDRISYRRNPERLGINGQFNLALTTGQADHLVVLGNDDLLLPGYVARMNHVLARHPDAAVVQPGVEVIDAAGHVVRPLGDRVKSMLRPRPAAPTSYAGEQLLASLMRGNWAYFPSLCWRRDRVVPIGFPAHYDVVLDLALLTEVLVGGGSMVVDPEVTFRYRRHAASLSSRQALDARRFAEERAFFDHAARRLAGADMPRAARSARAHLTSRLHAATLAGAAAARRDTAALRALVAHAAR
jgi:glycosyltransferase involved in cell wall biosynthesis